MRTLPIKCEATEDYPAHTLLLEATLASSTNQRRMEMEPVSRHLGDYLLSHVNEQAYCLFATTYLHVNVVSDFRMRRNSEYYSADGTSVVKGMKIIPCRTFEIKTIKLTKDEITKYYEDAINQESSVLIDTLIEKIVLYNDKMEIFFNNPLKNNGPDDKCQDFLFYTELSTQTEP